MDDLNRTAPWSSDFARRLEGLLGKAAGFLGKRILGREHSAGEGPEADRVEEEPGGQRGRRAKQGRRVGCEPEMPRGQSRGFRSRRTLQNSKIS